MRRNKYNNVRVKLDGHTFDSKAEAKRYGELKILDRAGEISGIVVHPKFELKAPSKEIIGIYEADFFYFDKQGKGVVEDVKGIKTALYRWKKKHVELQYGIKITEITK